MSPSRRLVAGIVVAFAAVLAVAAPASAHDELLDSSPASGERLAQAPAEVTLTFSADVLDTGAAVIIADADGRDWAVSDPTLDGGIVSVAVDPELPEGGYEVRWRVVSSDGHPISGLIPFTVGDGEALVRTAAPTTVDADGAESADPAQDQITQENEGALRLVLVGGIGAVVAVAVFVLIHFIRRGRRPAPGDSDPES